MGINVFFLFIFVSFGGKSHSPAWQIGDPAGIFFGVLNIQFHSNPAPALLNVTHFIPNQKEDKNEMKMCLNFSEKADQLKISVLK